jgi:hypothetical protein
MKLETYEEFYDFVRNNSSIDIQFQNAISEIESYFDTGMRATITSISTENYGDERVYFFVFDISKFTEYNKNKEIRNYYDDNGKPILTATEAGYAPENNIGLVYFSDFEDKSSPMYRPLTDYIKIISDERADLLKAYLSENVDVSYEQWLEQKLIAML